MFNRSKSTTPAEAPVSPAELVAAIQRKVEGLRAEGRTLHAEMIELEKAGVVARAPTKEPEVRTRAAELVNGFHPAKAPGRSPAERLHEIRFEYRAIEQAIAMLGSSALQARALALAAVMQERGEDWRQIVRRRALALLELRAANAAAADFRRRVVSVAKAPVSLVCDRTGGPLFVTAFIDNEPSGFLTAVVKAGILTQKEIDDAK